MENLAYDDAVDNPSIVKGGLLFVDKELMAVNISDEQWVQNMVKSYCMELNPVIQ